MTGKELLRAAILLVVILVVAFADVVFTGKSLVATDQYNPLDPWLDASNYGPAFVPAKHWQERGLTSYGANIRDPETAWWQLEPATEFLRGAIASGELPWWDPYSGFGTASLANLTGAYFFPPTVLLAVLGNTSLLRNIYYLLLFAFAGITTYLLLRSHGVGKMGSTVGSISFMLGGGLVQTIPSGFGQSAAFIPLLLLTATHLSRRSGLRFIAAAALVFALVALSSFPPILVGGFGLVVLYAIVAAVRTREWRPLAVTAAAAVLALGLTAFYYVPAFSLMRSMPQVADFYKTAGLERLEPRNLFQLLGPTLMGGTRTFEPPPLPQPSTAGFLFYVGVVSLVLALLGLGWRTANTLRDCCAVAAALILLKVLSVPPVHWIGYLPGLKTIHFATYLGIPLTFVISLLAGFGTDRIANGELRLRHCALIGGVLFGLFGALWLTASGLNVSSADTGTRWLAEFRFSAFLAAIAGVTLVAAAVGGPRGREIALTTAVVLLIVEVVANAFFPRQVRADVWRRSEPYVEFLRTRAGIDRVFSVGALPANTGSAFGVVQVDSLYTMNSPRAFQFYQKYFAPSAYLFMREASRFPPDGVLDSAAVRYVVIRKGLRHFRTEAERRGYGTVFEDNAVSIYSRGPIARYRFTTAYEVMSSEGALENIRRNTGSVFLEKTPSFQSLADETPAVVPEIVRFNRNSFVLRLNSNRPGLLYCSEADLPGWEASVNGTRTPILKANYAFRAVEIPPGRVVVEFRYRPPGFLAGAVTTVVSALGCLLLVVTPLPPRKWRSGGDESRTPFSSS